MAAQFSTSAEIKRALLARLRGFERYAEWQAAHPIDVTPGRAIAAATWLYELLPPSERYRSFDPTGISRLQRSLAVLHRTT